MEAGDRPIEDLVDERRSEPSFMLSERAMLEAWLEFHRTTLLLKCEGLTDAQRKARPIASSLLSLHGLIRHVTEGERTWFQRNLLHQSDAPYVWTEPPTENRAFLRLDDAVWENDLATWHAECFSSRAAAASRRLDDTGTRHGRPCSLRWVYVHAIEEYARHNGHADLLRELVDGQVGW